MEKYFAYNWRNPTKITTKHYQRKSKITKEKKNIKMPS